MLPSALDLSGQIAPDVFDFLYPLFERDFVHGDTYIANAIYVDPKGQGVRDGKEEVFWHITTRGFKNRIKRGNQFVVIKGRSFDPDRASRIEWIKPMLMNHTHSDIKLFYRKETAGKRPIRLYLWAHRRDFVIILQKLGKSSSFLVTCFYITETYKRLSYQKWHNEYTTGVHQDLVNCEWF
jgi:hypothetical protein